MTKHSGGAKVIRGEFQNLYGKTGAKRLWDILHWKLHKNPKEAAKKKEKYSLHVIEDKQALHTSEDFICWLGHASFIIQIDGKKIITDPCLTAPPFFKRHSALPFPITDIHPDYTLISHGHFDHLDAKTLQYFDQTIALIPLKMQPIIQKINPRIKTLEADWFQKYTLDENFEIYFLPAHHWHKRTMTDQNKVLWGSFVIKTDQITLYFSGDSAYSPHFEDIGEMFGNIDIAMLPIGAYEPRWFMKSNHMNPTEALKAFHDLRAKKMIPMHYGTFDLSDELLGDPQRTLTAEIKEEDVQFLDVGEVLPIPTILGSRRQP